MLTRVAFVAGLFCVLAGFSSAEESASAVKVVSYNIRYASPNDGDDVWPNRKEAVAAYLQGADIIGLQEVTEPQYAFLRSRLTGFKTYGVGRDDGKSEGEHTPIFFRDDRFESLAEGTFWLSEDPESVGSKSWDAAITRICSWLRLRERQSGKEFYVANTHFDHRGAVARHKSGELLARKIAELPQDAPVILLGDFNCVADSDPYRAITRSVEDARSVSEKEPEGPQSTWNGFKEIVPQRIIDHIFVRSVDVTAAKVENPKTAGGRFASDHLPVVAEVRLR